MQQYFASTSGVHHARPAFVLQGVHQSSLAYSSDLRVRSLKVLLFYTVTVLVLLTTMSIARNLYF